MTTETATEAAAMLVREAHHQTRGARKALLEALYALHHGDDTTRAATADIVAEAIDAASAAVGNLGGHNGALGLLGLEPWPE